jgi:hypothetical protein
MINRGWHFDQGSANHTTLTEREKIGARLFGSKNDLPIFFRIGRTGVLLQASLDNTKLWQISLAGDLPGAHAITID